MGLSAEQVDWFRGEVDSALAGGERVVVFQHNYPYQIWEDFDGPGIDDWRAIVQTRRVEAIVCGHTHYWQVANDGRNVAIATRSIGDPEGGPPGYALLYFRGDDLAATYRSVEDRGPVVLVTHPRERLLATGSRHIISGPDRVVVRTWSGSLVLSVKYRIDEGAWSALEPSGDGLWSGPLPGDRLAKGEHILEVVAVGGRRRRGIPSGRVHGRPDRPIHGRAGSPAGRDIDGVLLNSLSRMGWIEGSYGWGCRRSPRGRSAGTNRGTSSRKSALDCVLACRS